MVKFRCPKCNMIITNNLENCDDLRYLQCINPECEFVADNPNFKGEGVKC